MNLKDKFKIAVLEADAIQFEKLFSDVMSRVHPDFQKVRPHGNIGDRGNDGWLPSSGTYYQVYAPEELSANTAQAQKKVKDDFKKLKEYWGAFVPVKRFYFVLNDKYRGVSPHICKTLKEIEQSENLEEAGVYDTNDLERDLFKLPDDEICSVLKISLGAVNYLAEDKRKVREFLIFFSLAFNELFGRGREAGYLFPKNLLEKYLEHIDCDWYFEPLQSSNPLIARHQQSIRQSLCAMFCQLYEDPYYRELAFHLKYQPPFELKDRDRLIDEKKDSMGKFIADMESAYENIKEYFS